MQEPEYYLFNTNAEYDMNFEQLINNLTPDIHASLKKAIEIGKWPDGKALTQEQKELCMEAVINYEQRFLPEEQRVGYIDRGSKAEGEQCGDDASPDADADTPLKWH
ncbi:YeaC family protein [Oceanicoccus sp. KOV_DT_Chl]|uniref:YeaC family protein n=1 Tax=Oceanicoccus sp. KOV_DT_Chl TaxID=1904639 RepID=UPI003510AB76